MRKLNEVMDKSPLIKRMQEFKTKIENGKGWVKKYDNRPIYFKKPNGYYLYIGNEISNENGFNFFSFRTIIKNAKNLYPSRKQEVLKTLYEEHEYIKMYNKTSKNATVSKSGSFLDDAMSEDEDLKQVLDDYEPEEFKFIEQE